MFNVQHRSLPGTSDELSEILMHALSRRSEPPPSECDSWTDEEIIERLRTSPLLTPNDKGAVSILCPDTVVKRVHDPWARCRNTGSLPPEVQALQFVRSHTSIPTPKLRRYIPDPRSITEYMIIKKIEGTDLDAAWPRFTPLQRFLVAWTLRGYIAQLRRASPASSRSHVPGPMHETPRRCEGSDSLFGIHAPPGPFPTCKDLITYYNRRYKVPRAALPGCRSDGDVPLVFTHGDLCPHNIILGDDGRLWLIDFGFSGFYPAQCEYITMMDAATHDDNLAPRDWWDYMALITGGMPMKELRLMGLDGEKLFFHWLKSSEGCDSDTRSEANPEDVQRH